MTPRPPRPAYDRWRDVHGRHIADGCQVEQVAVEKERGALASRLGKRGEVLGRALGSNGNRLYVRFDGEETQVSIRPHLVRVVPAALSAEHIVDQLRQLVAEIGDRHG